MMFGKFFDEFETLFDKSKARLDLKLSLPLLHRKFKKKLGYELNLDNPKTINEKIQWMKFNTSGHHYVRAADKLEMPLFVRELIGEKICEGLFPKVLLETDCPNNIDFHKLPNRFVIKPNHGSGWVKIVSDKNTENHRVIREQCSSWLRRRYGYRQHEWPYLQIKPRIMVEELLENGDFLGANDVKLHLIHGKIERIKVFSNRFGSRKECLVTDKWETIFDNDKLPFPEPLGWEKMKSVAALLGQHFPHVRVDFLSTPSNFALNELTFFPQSGFLEIPYDYDLYLGNKLDINAIK